MQFAFPTKFCISFVFNFCFTIIAIFIEYPAGASAEERETGGPMKLFTKDLTLIETPKLIELVRVPKDRLFN